MTYRFTAVFEETGHRLLFVQYMETLVELLFRLFR
ncbi:hypothetical protein EV186_107251 [Labedaea rhizosphaerae]|uniref:Uncharacterized protein n=1 Tax=Labedaea rhizosphaerae TaxID=598644 RepID=A0A4R6S2X6_LABRH|nr:hypothetical protein EV186_107251 [Labedaea rhizosphaerae]